METTQRSAQLRGSDRDVKDASSSPPPAPCPVKSLAQIGQLAKDVLYGNRAEGLYGTAGVSKFSIASASTSTGLTLTSTATAAGPSSPLAGQLLVSYSRPGGWLGDLLVTSGGVAEATLSRTFTLPSQQPQPQPTASDDPAAPAPDPARVAPLPPPTKLVLGCVLSLPALADKSQVLPPKLTLDYSSRYLHLKSSATAAQKPLLTAAAVAGTGRVALGGEAAFSSSSRTLTRWSAAAAWHDTRQHIGLQLGAGSSKVTMLYGYSLQPGLSLGLEAAADVRPALGALMPPPPPRVESVPPPPSPSPSPAGTSGGGGAAAARVPRVAAPAAAAPTFSVGASYRLPAANGRGGGGGGGGVVKVKVSHRGVISLAYRDTLATGPRVTVTAELDGKDLGRVPKLGMQLEV